MLGADSMASRGCEYHELDEPKVWANRGTMMARDWTLFGACGTPRAIQIAKYGVEPPSPDGACGPVEVLYRWANAFRAVCKDLGYGLDGKDDDGVDFLVGFRGRWYEIQSRGGIVTHPGLYASTGCGGPEARAAMFALLAYSETEREPQALVQAALDASSAVNVHVRAPFNYVEMKVSD